MRFLHVGFSDASGVPSRWAQAHRHAGHQVRVIFEKANEFAYPTDARILRWTEDGTQGAEHAERISADLDWADAIMAYDHPAYLAAALETGKPVLFRALGTAARRYADELRDLISHPDVLRATTGTADLAVLLGIEQVGAPYPLLPRAEADETLLVHAPSNRVTKQTAAVIAAAEKTGWPLRIVEDATNATVLRAKRHCQAVVDSGPGAVPDGCGVNSLEAMSMGLPTICGCQPELLHAVQETGTPAQLVIDQDELERTLLSFRDQDLREELGDLGRRFIQTFHNGEQRVREDERALSGVLV